MLAPMRTPLLFAALAAGCAAPAPAPEARTATVVTFNSGTTEGLNHDAGPDDGYTDEHAVISDAWYGDGLAWVPVIDATRAFFDAVQPDVVVFQELFFPGNCPDIPAEFHPGFVCEGWQPGDLSVAERVLGPGWQVACHLGKEDKCAAVRRSFGAFAGCDDDLCLQGLDGARVPDCGSGSRVGRGVVELVDGGQITVVNVHGSSGLSGEDQRCRTAQFEQVFVDLDGAPAADGARNLVLGDLNTDPGRLAGFDDSAARWLDFVPLKPGDGGFRFHTEVGPDVRATYGGGINIDHVVSDFADGACWHAGSTPGHDLVTDARYFDHQPAVCDLSWTVE